jgi:hypothetical protein
LARLVECLYLYHGHGSSEQGRLNSDTMVAYKDLMPEQERTGRIVTAVEAVPDQTGRGMAEVALAWLRYRLVPVASDQSQNFTNTPPDAEITACCV